MWLRVQTLAEVLSQLGPDYRTAACKIAPLAHTLMCLLHLPTPLQDRNSHPAGYGTRRERRALVSRKSRTPRKQVHRARAGAALQHLCRVMIARLQAVLTTLQACNQTLTLPGAAWMPASGNALRQQLASSVKPACSRGHAPNHAGAMQNTAQPIPASPAETLGSYHRGEAHATLQLGRARPPPPPARALI